MTPIRPFSGTVSRSGLYEMRLAGVQKLRCGHEPFAERQHVVVRRLAPLHPIPGHPLDPSCATGQRDLQTSHINKPCFSTLPFSASLGALASTCGVPMAYRWRTRGVWNWPKTTLPGLDKRFLTAFREAIFLSGANARPRQSRWDPALPILWGEGGSGLATGTSGESNTSLRDKVCG